MLSKEVKLRRAINRNWKAGYRADQKQQRTRSDKAAFVRLVHRALRLGISQRMLLCSEGSAKRYGWSSAQIANIHHAAEVAVRIPDMQAMAVKVMRTQRTLRETGIV